MHLSICLENDKKMIFAL